MKCLCRTALAMLVVAACGRDGAITEPDAPNALPPAPGVIALGVDTTTGASIETNQDDYSPGEIVHVVGKGWAPGETVNLFMTEDPDTHEDISMDVQADSAGGFSVHFYDVQQHDLGVTFTLTATGQTSGSVAVATFTDGALSAAPLTVKTTGTPCGSANTTFTLGDEVCVTTTVSVSGGGAAPDLRIDWVSPANVVAFSETFPGVANGNSYTAKYTPTVTGAWKVRSCRTAGDCATDSGIQQDEEGFVVNGVVVSNTPPVLDPITDPTVNEGQTVSFTATATDDGLPNPPAALAFSLGTPSCLNPAPTPAASINSSSGAFSWVTTETDGPGVYCALIVVSDGDLSDSQEITITVNEVNQAPVLTVPASFSTQWGVALPDDAATATDADLPANTLTFSLVSGPSWVTVDADGTIHYGLIPASAVGTHTVTIKVEDDGSPPMNDEESYVITVTTRPTSLDYDGSNAGQYSDESTLSATLTDNGDGDLQGDPIVGQTVDLWFNGVVVCDDVVTNASGMATCDYQILTGAGTVKVKATFAAANGYAGSNSVEENFVVSEENATFVSVSLNGGNGSIPVSQTSFDVTFGVQELRVSGVEPDPNDGAMPGDIALATAEAKIVGLATNQQYTGTCVGSGGSASYASVRSFTCTFSGGPFVVDAYTLFLNIPTANDYWVATQYEEGFAIWDPAAGFATGGGWFILDGDRVSFGFSYSPSKGKTPPRSGFVVVRHMSGGGVCRVKSNNQMNAPAVSGNTVTLSGKGNYSCTDAFGLVIPGQSQGNISVVAYGEDWATSGNNADKFWVTNGASVSPQNYLQMSQSGGAAVNAVLIKGGNIQVPQPQRGGNNP